MLPRQRSREQPPASHYRSAVAASCSNCRPSSSSSAHKGADELEEAEGAYSCQLDTALSSLSRARDGRGVSLRGRHVSGPRSMLGAVNATTRCSHTSPHLHRCRQCYVLGQSVPMSVIAGACELFRSECNCCCSHVLYSSRNFVIWKKRGKVVTIAFAAVLAAML